MRMRMILAVAMAASFTIPAALLAQQDTSKCATVTVSRATEADIPALIEDAECFAKALQSAANSQALRLAKAKELAKRPRPAPTPSPSPTPTPAPTPTPTPTPDHGNHEPPPAPQPLTVADIAPLAVITDPAPYIWQVPVPGTAAPDVVGAFRLICNVSHLSYDDPIVYPKQPGKAHLHLFFGNTGADAHSTYASLRGGGGSTCQGDLLNRSAYWIPALLDGKGSVVVPNYVGLYYKRRPAADPDCTRASHKGCVGIPVGLRAIFGTNYAQGHNQSRHVRFDCNAGFNEATLAAVVERCRSASIIYARIEAPDCWNGRDLDSANHQDHLAYMFYDGTRATPRCPETHPYVIPTLTLIVPYAVLPGDTPETWIFSSDVQAGKPAGATFHADYMEAWEPAIRLRWEAHCLDKLLDCSAAVFGDGTQGKTPKGFTFEQRPHLVAAPAVGARSDLR